MSGLEDGILMCLKEAERYLDPTERVACFLACLQGLVRGKVRLVVTGGFAVELYTGSAYRTFDVDLVPFGDVNTVKEVERALERVGERPSREWLLKNLPKAIDFLPSDSPDAWEVETPCGVMYVEAPERLLIRYLASWKFWESSEDRDKALALAYALRDVIDWERARRLAKEEGVEDHLGRLEGWLRSLSRSSRKGG